MNDESYSLVLYFDAQHPQTYEQVRQGLLRLAPGSAAKLEPLMAKGRVVLKRQADPTADQRIVALFENTGAECRFEPLSTRSTFSQPIVETSPPATQTVPEPPLRMTCPRCHRTQWPAPECAFCGVIIEKARKQPHVAPAANLSPARPAVPQAASAARVGRRRSFPRRYIAGIERMRSWMEGRSSKKTKIQRWSQRMGDALTRCALMFAIAWVVEIVLLYLGHALWFVYTATPVGQYYLVAPGNYAQSIQHLLQMNLAMLALEVTGTALGVCLVAGLIGQFGHLIRFFHEPFGLALQLTLWALPLTAVTGWWLGQENPDIPMGIAYLISIVPTTLLLNRSIGLAQTLMPEAGTFISVAGQSTGGFRKMMGLLKEKMNASLRAFQKE